MCLIAFAWQPDTAIPLIAASNRDEFYQRPTQTLHNWHDDYGVIAGQDLEAGGTWLGINQYGRFAALTNIRDPKRMTGEISRGRLVQGFLQSTTAPERYLQALVDDVERYAGFNLLVGDRHALYFLNSVEKTVKHLKAGVYGLSNANLDTPWPKLVRIKEGLANLLPLPSKDQLLTLLHDPWQPADSELPETGVSVELERMLSSGFIQSDNYGTRASTALIINTDGRFEVHEKSFGPKGCPLGEVSINGRFSLAPLPQD